MQLAYLATDTLTQARQLGADAGDVIIAAGDSFSATVRLGKVEKILNSREKRMGLRLFVGKSSAITSTANFSRETVHALVEETVALARATAADEFSGLPERDGLHHECLDLDLVDTATALTPEEKIARAREAEAAALQLDTRITNSEGADFSNSAREIHYANTLGFAGQYHTTS